MSHITYACSIFIGLLGTTFHDGECILVVINNLV